ncbi:unnamed protein product, partial [marine sediment metagenome]
PKAQTHRDDLVYCKMWATLRGEEKPEERKSISVKIQDTPPEATHVRIAPNENLCVVTVYDEDGDTPITVTYELTKNNNEVEDQGKMECDNSLGNKEYECKKPLDVLGTYSPGDKIVCSVTPFSYGTPGEPKTADWTVPP